MTSEDVEARRLHRGLRRAFGETLRQVEGAWIEERAGYAVVGCPAIPIPGFNGVWVDGPDVMAPQTLAGAVDEVRRHGAPCWIELRADRTPAIRAAAVGLGFMREDTYPGMVATPQEIRLPGFGGPQISRVEGPSAIAEAIDVAAAGFEAPRELFAALYTPAVLAVPGLSVYLLRIGGRAVSTATAWLGDGAVGIFNVATPPAERGHGYGTLITAHAAWEGFAAGADLAWLQASAMGEPVYRRMGFRQVETYEVLGRPAAADDLAST